MINNGIHEDSWSGEACVSCSVVGLRGPLGTKAKVGGGGVHSIHLVPGRAPGTELEKDGSRFRSRKPL